MAGIKTENLMDRIRSMDREGLVRFLRNLDCDFPIDFTDEFLGSLSLGRLRHIILAAVLHARNVEADWG